MFVTDPIGIIGEEEAVRMLEKKRLRILEHNWRMGHLEVDLIAENRKEIVFVEVKARTTTFGGMMPEEYVDEDKKRRVIAAANVTYRHHLENAIQPQIRTITSGSYSGSWRWKHRGHTIGRSRK